MKISKYFIVELKRVKKLVAESFVMSVIFALCLCYVIFFFVNKSSFSEDQKKYNVGIVGTEKNDLLNIGIQLIKNLDQTKYIIDFQNFNTIDDAENALSKNEIIAFIDIPKDFADSIYNFTNDSTITVHTKSGLKGITDVVMGEIANLASTMILYTEAGLFSLMDYMEKNQISYKVQNENVSKLFMKYVEKIIKRGDLTKINELGISRGLSPFGYYLCSLLLFYILMVSFGGISFFTGQNKSLESLLNIKGINSFSQISCEACAFLIYNLFSVLFLVIPVSILFFSNQINVPEFHNFDFLNVGTTFANGKGYNWDVGTTFVLFMFKLFPVILCFSLMELFVFQLFESLIGKILFSFILFFAFCYISGYFYPQNFLPESLSKIGEFLPTGQAFSYASSLLNTKHADFSLIFVILYSVIFYFSSVLVRFFKIKKGFPK